MTDSSKYDYFTCVIPLIFENLIESFLLITILTFRSGDLWVNIVISKNDSIRFSKINGITQVNNHKDILK